MVQTQETVGKHKDTRLSSGKFSIVVLVYEIGVVTRSECMQARIRLQWLQARREGK